MFYISGFTDEISSDFEEQLQAAKKLGLKYISLRTVDGENIGECSVEHIKNRVLPLCKAYDIGVSSIASPLGKALIDDDAAYAAQLEAAARIAQIAQLLSTAYVRVFSFYLPEGKAPELFGERVLERLGGFLRVFSGSNTVLLHENEKKLYGDTPERCLELLNGMNAGEGFGLIFDPANFVQAGVNAWEAFALLRKHIRYFHVKDALRESGVNVVCGTGDGHLKRILASLKKSGYEGFLTLEPHLVEFEGLAKLEALETKSYIDTARGVSPYDGFRLQLEAVQALL